MTDLTVIAEATRLTKAGRLAEATALLRGGARRPAQGRGREGTARRTAPDDLGMRRGRHTQAEGARAYGLYLPAKPALQPALVVMLHGCTQDADDFARGTRMNEHAEREGFVVLYPEQDRAANPNGCWNWFEAQHQAGRGESAILAGMIRAVAAEVGADPARIFVCGLSAGGAMAANLAHEAPGLVAGALVHSGLPAGAASDLPGALKAMQQGAEGWPGAEAGSPVPLLVVHGDADRTVSVCNAEGLASQALGGRAVTVQSREAGRAGGRGFVRVTEATPEGRVLCETITVEGGGHGWSGGDPRGSHVEAGIDASAAAVRFFGLARRPG